MLFGWLQSSVLCDLFRIIYAYLMLDYGCLGGVFMMTLWGDLFYE